MSPPVGSLGCVVAEMGLLGEGAEGVEVDEWLCSVCASGWVAMRGSCAVVLGWVGMAEIDMVVAAEEGGAGGTVG